MKTLQFATGLAAFLLTEMAVAQVQPLGVPLGTRLGIDLPLGSLGLLGVTAIGLIVGVRIARRKRR